MSDILKKEFGDWYNYLSPFLKSDKFVTLKNKLKTKKKYAPKSKDIFKAFKLTQFKDVKVVIINKEVYNELVNEVGQTKKIPLATGLAFGIPDNILYTPPSLKNIIEEIEKEYDELLLNNFDYTLESWAKQGVLLLNTSLTCEYNKAGSHNDIWKDFTNYVIKSINENSTGVIWLLWGDYSKVDQELINTNYHHVLESGSPSEKDCNKGFWFGNNHFKKTNELIEKMNGEEFKIKWFRK